MALLNTYRKQPADALDYDIDYAEFLDSGDAVDSGSVVVTPAGLTVSAPIVTDSRLKLWVSGGTDATTYKVTVTMTTTHGRVKQDELKFKVKDI